MKMLSAGFELIDQVKSGFAEEEERAKIHSHFAQPDYLDPDV